MKGAWAVAAIAVALAPGRVVAHDAFGDMGPFYANLLHPLADPMQGLVLIGAAAFLARQTLDGVRAGYAALALAGIAAAAAATLGLAPALPTTVAAALGCLLGAAAMIGRPAPRLVAAAAGAAAGGAAGLALGPVEGMREATLGFLGGAAGVALAPLLAWALADMAVRRIGPVAGAVIGSWVAAVGIMTAALGI